MRSGCWVADAEHDDRAEVSPAPPGGGVWSVGLVVLAMAALGLLLRLIFDLLF